MPKVKINSTVKTHDKFIKKEHTGLIIDNKIIYNDENVIVTLLFYKNKLVLNRNDKESNFNCEFLVNFISKGSYSINEQKLIINFDVKTKELIIEDNFILIDYDLYQANELVNSVLFKLAYEVIK